MSQKKKQTYAKKDVPSTKKLTEETSMRNRPLSKGETLLMKIGVGVIAATVIVILSIVLISPLSTEETIIDPLETYTHVTTTELTYLFGYDIETETYGDFTYFFNSELEDYQAIDAKLQDSTTEEIYVLMYRSSSFDQTLLDAINTLEETLLDAAFFVLDLDLVVNETVFESSAISGLAMNPNADAQLITFYIEGKEFSDGNTYFFDTVWNDTKNITISLENI
ncbi:MAG: hypothetical protein ACPF9F_00530 [Acholeplasmataceae bacterium]